MSYYVRYFAETPVAIKALGAALKSMAPEYKIDGGDLMRGADVLAEVGIDSAGSDLFVEELGGKLAEVEQLAGQAAQWVGGRLRNTQSIIAVRIDPAVNWDLLAPLWAAMTSMSTGLMQVDGQGFYDGANLILPVA
jgi:hypothetical protein